MTCPHPPFRRRTIIRSHLGTVEECEWCGEAFLDPVDERQAHLDEQAREAARTETGQ